MHATILAQCTWTKAEVLLPEEQNGFRKGRSNINCVFTIQHL
jgi:hypothetical protein